MSLKQRATKCSGYIPPSQYVPVYSRPLSFSNLRRHEELSPITPKPSFDDPDNSRSRSIQQAVKAWLESSPKSVIGGRGRSPTHSPRTSVSSPDRAVTVPLDGELDQEFGEVCLESPTFQRTKLTPWRDIVGKVGDSPQHSDNHTSTENKTTSGDQLNQEEEPVVDPKKIALQEEVLLVAGASEVDTGADNYSQAIMEALRSSPIAPESYLKPPRVLEKPLVRHAAGQGNEETLPQKKTAYERSEVNIDEIRGKELEDFRARGFDGRRTAAVNKGGVDFASDFESLLDEVNDGSGFTSSAVSSPLSFFEERRFGGDGMNLIQIAGSGEFAADSVYQKGQSNIKPGTDLSSVSDEFDPVAENRRPTRNLQNWRTSEPPNETDTLPSQMTRQEESFETQSRPVSGLSALHINGGKRDGPTKTAAVVPIPEDSQCNTSNAGKEKSSIPLGGVDSNQMQIVKQPINRQRTLEKVRKEKFSTKAAAWEEAKYSQYFNRYKREETKIMAWEDHKKAKAEINLKKVELKLQEKRAKAIEKMENEVAKAHKKAEAKKAMAEAKRAEKAARAAEEAEIIRQRGRRPLALFCFTP